jgi:hypothetical protein
MEELQNSTKIFLPKTLRQIIFPGTELKRANGHINISNLQGLLVGHLNDFDIDLRDVPGYKANFLVVYDKLPTTEDKIVVKVANCYSLRVEVCSD